MVSATTEFEKERKESGGREEKRGRERGRRRERRREGEKVPKFWGKSKRDTRKDAMPFRR